MKFINLTPHAVTLANGDLRIIIEKQPEDPIVRVEHNIVKATMDYELAPGVKVSLPLDTHLNYKVVGLPDPQPGVTYIVSSMVASRVRRADVVSPLTDSTCERAEDGRVLSVRGFQTYIPGYGDIEEMAGATEVAELVTASEEVAVTVELVGESQPEPIDILMETAHDIVFINEAPVEVQKVDPIMLDPIKLAAKLKYEKRMARSKVRK